MQWAERVAASLGLDLSTAGTSLQRVESAERVRGLLLKAIADGVDVFGDFVSPFERQHLSPLRLRGDDFELGVLRAPAGFPRRLRLFFGLGSLTYSFEAEVLRQGALEIAVGVPRALDFGEQRHAPRWAVNGGLRRTPLVQWSGNGKLAYPLEDLSRTGFSLRVPEGRLPFESGRRLSGLEVRVQGEPIGLPPAEVRHITSLDGSRGWRVGVEVGVLRRAIRARHLDFPLWEGARPPRAARPGPGRAADGSVDVVRYFNRRGERIVGILDTTFGSRADEPVPVVVLPPATGRRKETLSALALTIVENFRLRGRQVAVLRFDGVRRHGESANDPEGRRPGMEMVHSTMGQAIADIHATLDYLHDNERFRPSRVAVISMSSASIEARRALVEDGGRRIHYWISLAGAPDFHDTLKNICGGLDLLGSHRNGVPLGVLPVLGNPVDLDRFFADAFERRLVYLRDALEEIPDVAVPVTWIYGRYDDWVRPERVQNLMSVHCGAPRQLFSIPTGHQMRTSEEAMEAFKLVTACLWKFFHGGTIRSWAPAPAALGAMREAEKSRLARTGEVDHRRFWREYLERKGRYLGFDIIRETDAYRDLMQTQIAHLDLRGAERILDAGCGTGNLAELLLERALSAGGPMPGEMVLTDYVSEALDTARGKLTEMARRSPVELPAISYRTVDLEISRLGPVAEALEGDAYRWERLEGRVEGLSSVLLARLRAGAGPEVIRAARGDDPRGASAESLITAIGRDAAEALEDLGRAARFLGRGLLPEDFRESGLPDHVDLSDTRSDDSLTAASLRWKRLNFGTAGLSTRLPFGGGAYDRVISSLVVCYLYRPEATIGEFHRILAPGGRLVLSSMKPDADVSRIYMRLIERLRRSPDLEIPPGLTRDDLLNSARTFLNKAAGILNLEEAGAFEFLPRERLIEILRGAGFDDIRVTDSFGDPPQAYVLSGIRI